VSSGPVIEALDEFKDNTSNLPSYLETFFIDTLALETVEETFCDCIIIAVACTDNTAIMLSCCKSD
jgi:hypothetical protein